MMRVWMKDATWASHAVGCLFRPVYNAVDERIIYTVDGRLPILFENVLSFSGMAREDETRRSVLSVFISLLYTVKM